MIITTHYLNGNIDVMRYKYLKNYSFNQIFRLFTNLISDDTHSNKNKQLS